MNPLLETPTADQRRVLEIIYEGRKLASSGYQLRWPIFQFVEHELYKRHEIDAMDALNELPVVGGRHSGGPYGWTWFGTRQPEDEIGLTVAGMSHIAAANREVTLFVAVLRLLVEQDRSFQASPTTVQTITLTSVELAERLPSGWHDGSLLAAVPALLGREPATWHTSVRTTDDGWELELRPFLRRYQRLDSVQEYLERTIEILSPVVAEASALYPSSLSLPEAIDYLNAIWRLHAGRALIKLKRAEGAAKLALDCTSADEFESRLSAVCAILDALDIPGNEHGKLLDLSRYLQTKLSEESSLRAASAIDDLRALFDLRVWRQHAGTEDRAARGMNRLGISPPVYDWGDAWRLAQAVTVRALAALREEVETLIS